MAQFPSAPAPQVAPSGPDAGGAPEGAEPMTITITCVGDGTYTIEQGDAQDDAQDESSASTPGDAGPDSEQPPVTVQSVADVLHVVKQMLAASGDGASAWNQEAASRDATGMPKQPGAGPAMTM